MFKGFGKGMMKKGIPIIIVVQLLILTPTSSIATSERYQQSVSMGNTLYVGGSGPNNYTHIQEAINDASDGDTIFVYNGVYYENVVVNKKIRLIGEDKNNTVIDGGGSRVIRITQDNTKIQEFTITNGNGILVSSDNNIICNNILTKGGGDGIQIDDGKNSNVVYMNKISDCGYGILLRYEGNDNHIISNTISQCEYGILVNCLSYNLTGNSVYENEYGIYVASLGNIQNYVYDNIVENNSKIGIGIESYTSECLVQKNYIANSESGITIESGEENTIMENIITDTFFGIRIYYSKDNVITRNTIKKSIIGIETPGANNEITMNNFFGNIRHARFCGLPTKWDGKYWNWARASPKPIFGLIIFCIPWLNSDWHPAQEPIDIWGRL